MNILERVSNLCKRLLFQKDFKKVGNASLNSLLPATGSPIVIQIEPLQGSGKFLVIISPRVAPGAIHIEPLQGSSLNTTIIITFPINNLQSLS